MQDLILLIPYFIDYNGLLASLKSIDYPHNKFEVLVIDDGSPIPLNITELQAAFPGMLIQLIRLPENQGIVTALNTGLKALHKYTDYKYIARLDCGDTCAPNRFTEQVNFMNEHPDIALLGTWCSFTEKSTGKSYLYKTKLIHEAIIKEMHFKCSFIHPTVMFRREVLDSIGYYPENYPHAEDYAYFWEILRRFKGAILPRIYVDIATSSSSISVRSYKEQLVSRKRVVHRFGTNPILKIAGIALIYMRSIIPAKLIIKIKHKLY